MSSPDAIWMRIAGMEGKECQGLGECGWALNLLVLTNQCPIKGVDSKGTQLLLSNRIDLFGKDGFPAVEFYNLNGP